MTDSPDKNSTDAAGIGCAVLVMGIVGVVFGVAALLGVGGVELGFFGIDLNDRTGRWLWVAGCVLFGGVGWFVLRRGRRA